ncbi:MAG: hypothetical protein J6B55_02440, partial [Clostridia bacterium]|nr:hypothetical protein [Clostridia bacterium]
MRNRTIKTLLCLILTAMAATFLFACGKPSENTPDTAVREPLDSVSDTLESSRDESGSVPTEDEKDPFEGLSREEFFEQKQLVIYRELPEGIIRNFDYKVTVTQGD